jgi:hypothetical protein
VEALQQIAAALAIPGLPGWSGLVVLLLLALFVVAFLLMPFHVIGVKGRLDQIEARLDDLHAELRALALRLPEAPRRGGVARPEEDWADPPLRMPPPRDAVVRMTPPVPPPAVRPERGRNEPRLG